MSKGIQVVVRFRPLNETEKINGPAPSIDIYSNKEIAVVDKDAITTKAGGALNVAMDQQKQFTFDHVFNQESKQEDLFEAVGKPVVQNVLKGYNGTILAYGQTGSGKTHSMLGPEGGTVDVLTPSSPYFSMRGMIPRLVEELFARLTKVPQQEVSWKVSASVFELYKEAIQDLLTEGPQQEYKIREDTVGGKGVYVDNLYAKQCLSAPELLEAVRVGVTRRKVASTKSNETSSRSHSMTVIIVEQTNHVQGGTVTCSRLNLVDLAGSEKVGKTHADGERLKEAQMINLSLTLLGNVIYKLTDGKSGYIPYRDSKLTRILQDSFGGNSMTTLLCHCSAAMYNRDETVSTLRFAARAKQIKNAPRVNRELSQKELQLQLVQALDRIKQLEERLAVQSITQEQSSVRRSQLNRSHADPEVLQTDPADLPPGAITGDSETDELRRLVDSLLGQIEESKADLFAREEALAQRDQQVEFYKQKALEAEQALQESLSRQKRDEQLWQRRYADLEAENSRLLQQLETKNAVLVDAPMGFASPMADVPSVSKRVAQAPVQSHRATNLRKATETQRVSVGTADVQQATVGGVEVIQGSGRAKIGTPKSATLSSAGGGPSLSITGSNLKDVSQQQQQSGRGRKLSVGGNNNDNASMPMSVESLDAVSVQNIDTLEAQCPTPPPGAPLDPPAPRPQAPVETAEIGIMALVGKSEAELQKEIDDIQTHMKQLMLKSTTLTKQINESREQIAALNDVIERTKNERDDFSQELDALRKMLESQGKILETKEKENEFMKRILDELNINLSDFQHLLSDEKNRNNRLKEEADRLADHNNALRQTAEQQEFVEMVTMELLVKTEDMDAVEQDMMRMPTLPTEELFLKKRDFCLQILRELSKFLDHITHQLSRQKFNTGNLESRRLQLIDEAANLIARCDDATTMLKG